MVGRTSFVQLRGQSQRRFDIVTRGVSPEPQSPDSLFDQMQPQNLSASYPCANQECQRHPQQYHDHNRNRQERNVK